LGPSQRVKRRKNTKEKFNTSKDTDVHCLDLTFYDIVFRQEVLPVPRNSYSNWKLRSSIGICECVLATFIMYIGVSIFLNGLILQREIGNTL